MVDRKYCSLIEKKVSISEESVRCGFSKDYICLHPKSEIGNCFIYEGLLKNSKIQKNIWQRQNNLLNQLI